MNIQHIHGVPPLYTNTFLIVTNAKHGILIDAAAEPGVYLKALDEAGATLTHILLTHGHYDHVGAVAALKKATGCKVYMDKADAQGSQLLPLTPDVVTDEWPADGKLQIDELPLTVCHTPGHTPGGVCIACYGLMFSGDTLFAGSCGRHGFPRRQHAGDGKKPVAAGRIAAARCNKSPARPWRVLDAGAGAAFQSLYEWGMVLMTDHFDEAHAVGVRGRAHGAAVFPRRGKN